MQPVYRDVKASGIRLRVTEAGRGPPLLLLHTSLVDRTSWDATLPLLTRHFRVIAPDLPGFGESEKPSRSRFGYGVSDFAHVVTDLFAGLRLGQASIVGHGLGGAIALYIASKSPELVDKLVVVDALCYATRPDLARRVATLPVVGGLLFKQFWGRTLFGTYFRDLIAPHHKLSSARVDHYYSMFNTPSARNSAVATLVASADTRTVEVRLARLSVPTLVIWGRHDAVHPAAFGQRLSKEIPGAGFRLLDAGHLPMEESPQELSENIRRFCS